MSIRKLLEVLANVGFWSLLTLLFLNLFVQQSVEIELIDGEEVVRTSFEASSILFHSIALPFKITFYYLHVYYLSKSFDDKRFKWYSIKLFFSIILFIFLEFLLSRNILGTTIDLAIFLKVLISSYTFLSFASFAHIIIIRWSRNEKMKQVLREEQIRNELNQLKAQINPHFLFNALNNLLSISEKNKQEALSAGIINLSEMLRFSLHEMTNEHIPLRTEIRFIQNYIKLSKMRFDISDPIDIQVRLNNISEERFVAPVIFFPFVENALKHGIDLEKNSFVHIEISVLDGGIQFTCENSIGKSSNEGSGIGLENVKRRLELLYEDRHQLLISQKNSKYKVDLLISDDV